MKKFITALVATTVLTTASLAETFTYIVPAGVDGGNAKWAQQFTKQWNKQLKKHGHEVVLRYVKGQRGRKGLSKWASEMSDDNTVVVQTQGLINYLTTKKGWKGFDPRDVDVIGGQLQGTFVFKKTSANPGLYSTAIHIDGGAEVIVDAMASSMMMCGNMTTDSIIACSNHNTRWVRGFKKGGERRQAYLNNQIQVSRDGFSHMRKTYRKELKSGETEVWYSHGVTDFNGDMKEDPNHPSSFFNKVFREKFGEEPSGRYYDAYKQIIKMRSGLGKTVFTKKDNPYYDVLSSTFKDTYKDKKSKKKLDKKLGKYEWHNGSDSNNLMKSMWEGIRSGTLYSIVKIRKSFGEKTDYKKNLVE